MPNKNETQLPACDGSHVPICSPLPLLPETMSNDGREIWDWADKLSAWAQRQDRIRELRQNLRICGTRCGDCDKWMKSRQCPREKPGEGKRSGYSVGPSCADLKCREYVETSRATQRRADLTRDLESILANAEL